VRCVGSTLATIKGPGQKSVPLFIVMVITFSGFSLTERKSWRKYSTPLSKSPSMPL
jgi:hypothetical protein